MSQRTAPAHMDVPIEDLHAIVARAENELLAAEDVSKLHGVVDMLGFIIDQLRDKRASSDRLRYLLFGPSTEKTSMVLDTGTDGVSPAPHAGPPQPKKKRPGHGRNGADAYRGARRVTVPHESLCHGDGCPDCTRGKVYRIKKPELVVRIFGMAPLSGLVGEIEKLRCGACGKVFKAKAPPELAGPKYDETASGMVGMIKYGAGMPFNRIEGLQHSMGIPLPAATQWTLVEAAADKIEPAAAELARQAAQGDVLHNDDTTMKVLELMVRRTDAAENKEERKAVYTSGIVATAEGRRIALFFTGHKHAGENLADVLKKRQADLDAPIQMCDALAANTAGELKTILSNCIAHARRRFVEVVHNFPDECKHVLLALREVYKTDASARTSGVTAQERLRLHQSESGPVMEDLEKWMKRQIDEHLVEPNSGLGQAIRYMTKHWTELTLFLREPDAPLDNNVCERALKKAILHRKNSLFYKTENGARVGDIFMTLIHTAELNDVDPFDYLVALQRHHQLVTKRPGDWMPWTYRATIARATAAPDPAPILAPP